MELDPKNEIWSRAVKDFQDLGNQSFEYMQIYAVKAVRNPKDKDQQEMARDYVIKHDTQKEVADKSIEIFRKYWFTLKDHCEKLIVEELENAK